MKAYAFVGYFDQSINKIYQHTWQFLSSRHISNYGMSPKNRQPHITLADYYDLDEENFIRNLEGLYQHQTLIDIELTQLGTFLGTGTLFYSPTMSMSLNTLHSTHHNKMQDFKTLGSYYNPGKWTPHVTVASRLIHEEMMKAFEYCKRSVIQGQITKLSLIEIIIETI